MLEKMYTDFVTNMLPKVSEGLMITKEYFTDLFGRYVQYLIVTDCIFIGIGLLLFFVGLFALFYEIKGKCDADGGLIVFGLFMATIGLFVISTNTFNLVKTIYIPEVRIYEEIKLRM